MAARGIAQAIIGRSEKGVNLALEPSEDRTFAGFSGEIMNPVRRAKAVTHACLCLCDFIRRKRVLLKSELLGTDDEG